MIMGLFWKPAGLALKLHITCTSIVRDDYLTGGRLSHLVAVPVTPEVRQTGRGYHVKSAPEFR